MQIQQNIIIQLLFVTIFFSLSVAVYDYELRLDVGTNNREDSPDIDLKDGEYGYKIYYDDGDYDFDDKDDQDEQETDGLCSLVNQTNRDVQYRNDKALEKMEKYMEIYVLANSLRDYAQFIKSRLSSTSVNLTTEVRDAVESAQRDHIDIEDLTYLYKTLVAIPDNYPALANDTDWKNYVIFQLESVKDYIGEHFQYFKRELAKVKTSRLFYKRRNFYVNLENRGGLMSIFYYWFDSRVCKPRMFDEAQIREKLKEHLKYVIDLPEHVNATDNAAKPEIAKSVQGTGGAIANDGQLSDNIPPHDIQTNTAPDIVPDANEHPSEDAAASGNTTPQETPINTPPSGASDTDALSSDGTPKLQDTQGNKTDKNSDNNP